MTRTPRAVPPALLGVSHVTPDSRPYQVSLDLTARSNSTRTEVKNSARMKSGVFEWFSIECLLSKLSSSCRKLGGPISAIEEVSRHHRDGDHVGLTEVVPFIPRHQV
jgi:hypothetical protein